MWFLHLADGSFILAVNPLCPVGKKDKKASPAFLPLCSSPCWLPCEIWQKIYLPKKAQGTERSAGLVDCVVAQVAMPAPAVGWDPSHPGILGWLDNAWLVAMQSSGGLNNL